MKELKTRGKGSFASKVIKTLGIKRGLRVSIPSREKKIAGISLHYTQYDVARANKELKNVLVRAESLKAKHIMEIQRRHSIR